MRIENNISSVFSKQPASAKSHAVAQTDAIPSSLIPATSLVISGQALLRQRLFSSHPNVEPPMLDPKRITDVLQPLFCLNKEDRLLLGDIYEFAQAEGVDLDYVDRLGHKLANYRGYDDGRQMGPANQGKDFDLEGHQISYSFTDKDATTAQRIRQSSALLTTRLDRGFINYDTDKDYSSLSHSHFEFLEAVVNRFSDSYESVPINGRFQKHEYVKNNFIKHVSKEVYKKHMVANLRQPRAIPEKQGSELLTAAPAAAPTLREILHNYLQKTGLPTLFETLMRMGR
jgi:hypothetical protein